MKKQNVIPYASRKPCKTLVIVLVFIGSLGAIPYLGRAPRQSERGGNSLAPPSSAPLIGVTSSTKNPLQVALLHWYDANLTTAFDVSNAPVGVAFDGANIWVTNAHG